MFDYTIKHMTKKDNHIVGALTRMDKYLGASTIKDHLIPHSIDSITIRPLQEITTYHINLSDHSTSASPTCDHLNHNMAFHKAINFTNVDYNFNKCRGRPETTRQHHSCLYLDEEHMELTNKNDYKVIK